VIAWLSRLLLWGLLLCLPNLVQAEVPLPPLKARVTDLSGALPQERKAALERRLAEFEGRKGAQVAVLVLPTVRPESIEQFGIRLAEQWKLGRKGVDDGLILIVALSDREMRIEVGYGLEGVVPDVVAKRIIEEVIIPRFKAGDVPGGIEAGVDKLLAVIDGEPLPPPASDAGSGAGDDVDLLFPVFMIAIVAGSILRALLGRLLAAGACGGVAALVAGLMGASLFGIAGIAILVFLFILMGGSGIGGGGGGGWSSGGGGGFSGGGGSFGGGGASGRW